MFFYVLWVVCFVCFGVFVCVQLDYSKPVAPGSQEGSGGGGLGGINYSVLVCGAKETVPLWDAVGGEVRVNLRHRGLATANPCIGPRKIPE